MAEKELNLQKGDKAAPRIKMGEIGTTGLSIIDSEVDEQIRKELQWPCVIDTYKKMMNDPMIYAGISLIEMMIAKVDWKVQAPEGATEDQEKKTRFIAQCMDDMDHTWESFIREVTSYLVFGFSVQEKVFRKRNKEKGSKYSDNLIGWKKLGPRSQDTIWKWEWSEDGRQLTAVYQDLSKVNNEVGRFNSYFKSKHKEDKGLKIPRNKFLLFRYNPKRDNPLGNSPLNPCWLPYRFRTIIEEQESIGISRDMTGMPVLGLHPKYMSPDATPEDQAVYDYYKNVIRNIHNNEQSGLIYPLMYNDQGKKIIEFDLMGVQGGKQYDTDKIIKRWDDKILTALFADILKLGQQSHGSFSLAGAKTNIVAMHIETRLKEIADVLNNDLIPQTFELNGWDDTEFPKFVFEDLDEEDLDEFSKLIQRVGSVGFLPKDQIMVYDILRRAGFSDAERVLDMEDSEFNKLFPEAESRAGDGMKSAGEGTSNKVGGEDNSTSNNENA